MGTPPAIGERSFPTQEIQSGREVECSYHAHAEFRQDLAGDHRR